MEEVKREKEWKKSYSNGKIKREASFKNAVQHGLGSSYFHDSKLLMRGKLITRLQDGVLKRFYPSGQVGLKLKFIEGNREGL